MSKNTNFIGQPVFNQRLFFLDKQKIKKISEKHGSDHYVKQFDSYNHLITMLYCVIGHFASIREVIIGLLSNANKLSHLGLMYCVKRSTLADANKRRSSLFFKDVYLSLLEDYKQVLSDSSILKKHLKNLYVMDSTTITLFKQILKGAGRNPIKGKKKGGIKAHTLIKYDEQVPCFVSYSASATHDHILLKSLRLPIDSFIVFDMGYVDYKAYELFSQSSITYVTKMKKNAVYYSIEEIEIPEESDYGIIKDEKVYIRYGRNKESQHICRRIAYWSQEKNKLDVFLSNNFELTAEEVVEIYKARWTIETLFKCLKQNFPLKYFIGDNVNAIEIQIWCALIAFLLLQIAKKNVKKQWAFSNMITFIRINLMSYVSLYAFLENPEKAWLSVIKNREKPIENLRFNF